jgi:GntR family transcriptional regulator
MVTQRAIPIVDQVDQILRTRISAGEYEPGTRLPSEIELASNLGVSRTTIRTVLARLESQGVITRKHGDGTYVNKHVLEIKVNPTKMMAFRNLIEESGRIATVSPIVIKTMQPSKEVAKKLNLSPQEQARQVICLFLADDLQAILSENYFPDKIFHTPSEELDVNLPINEFIRQYSNEKLAYSISDFRAVSAPKLVANQLRVKEGEPILHSIDLFYNLRDQPLAVGFNYFSDKAYKLCITQSWT